MKKIIVFVFVLLLLVSSISAYRIYWKINQKATDNYLRTSIIALNDSTLEITVSLKQSVKNNYRWHMALCGANLTTVKYQNQDTQGGFNYSTPINLNYGKLTNYGLPAVWCNKTNNYGYILFSSSSANNLPARFRVIFLPNEITNKNIDIYTGDSTDIETLIELENPAVYKNPDNTYDFINITNNSFEDLIQLVS